MQDHDSESADPAGAGDGDLGRKLQAARESKGLSIEDVAAELRIERRALAALEACRFEDIGPPVFVKGYLRHYGNRLGLNYNDLLADYYRIVEPRDFSIAPSRTIKLYDERQITIWIISALFLALLGVFLFVWLVDEPVEPTLPAAVESLAPQPDLSPPADAGSGLPLPVEDEPVLEPLPDVAPADESLEAPLPDAGNGPPTADAPAADGAPSAQAPQPARAAVPAVQVSIDLAFSEDSWVAITDSRGARLFYGLGRSGERASMAGRPPIDVLLGNAGGVELTVDGSVFDVPSEVRQGNLARFTLDGP